MHFAAWVVVPEDEAADGVITAVHARMEPYGQEQATHSSQEDCYCIGDVARREISAWSEQVHADLYEDVRLRAVVSGQDLLMQRVALERQAREALHPLRGAPDPACVSCDGTGQMTVQYNPDARWDWWEVGGRWTGAYDPTGEGRDILPVAEVAEALAAGTYPPPMALVDVTGAWREMENPWSQSDVDTTQWAREVTSLIAEGAGALIACVDCHF